MNINMFTGELDYTVSSTDEEHYNRINCCLTAPITKNCSMTVTSLTTNCNTVVHNADDYIMINGKQYFLGEDFTNIKLNDNADLMNRLFEEKEVIIKFLLDTSTRLVITST